MLFTGSSPSGRSIWSVSSCETMNIQSLILILVSTCLSASAQVSFKLGVSTAATNGLASAAPATSLFYVLLTPAVVGGLARYSIGTLLWLSVLGGVELSHVYFFVGPGFVVTALMDYLLFGEVLGLERILGRRLLIGGTVIVARS